MRYLVLTVVLLCSQLVLAQSDTTINVSNANELVLYISIATSFNSFEKDPLKDGLNSMALTDTQLELNGSIAPNLPTDERLKRYSQGAIDNSLESLYFQYGRYLLISCSRTALIYRESGIRTSGRRGAVITP
jgi:alpha-L-fucosidase 2